MKCWSPPDSWSIILPGVGQEEAQLPITPAALPEEGMDEQTDRQRRLLSPWHSNFLAGVVSSSFPSMSGGPAQRAMPGSLYPVLTQLESQRRLQLQYRGLAPMALQGQRKVKTAPAAPREELCSEALGLDTTLSLGWAAV